MIWGAPFSSHYVARDFNTEVFFVFFFGRFVWCIVRSSSAGAGLLLSQSCLQQTITWQIVSLWILPSPFQWNLKSTYELFFALCSLRRQRSVLKESVSFQSKEIRDHKLESFLASRLAGSSSACSECRSKWSERRLSRQLQPTFHLPSWKGQVLCIS